MNTEKFQNKYRISSARAVWHDYNGGIYFVTICTKDREYYFGKIECCRDAACHISTTTMILSEIGKFADDCIKNTINHYPYAEIPLYVVMPNHIHLIVVINGDKAPLRRVVETRHDASLQSKQMTNIANQQGWLSVVIGSIKSATTKYANENNLDFAWQPRFHDHIVRNQDELNNIADYIKNNVAQWNKDCFNGSRDAACHVSMEWENENC